MSLWPPHTALLRSLSSLTALRGSSLPLLLAATLLSFAAMMGSSVAAADGCQARGAGAGSGRAANLHA